ncbi:MAG: helix-turn-helix transcriptional regulator [Bdellovibrionaceae bacterium]|nr:helix-turn-helix transcriptional regulator [Bdellovibrio sp.]
MSYEVTFGLTLQTLRLAKNFSQAELAKASQIDRTFISLLERGIRQPSLTTVFHLANALDMKPSELVAAVEKRVRRARWKRLT